MKQRTCKNYFYDLPVELQVHILSLIPRLRSDAKKLASKGIDKVFGTCVPKKKPPDTDLDRSRHPEQQGNPDAV